VALSGIVIAEREAVVHLALGPKNSAWLMGKSCPLQRA
jgi:hypothetical protein